MKARHKSTRGRRQEGVALLIAIFVLLLVSVVAIALLVSSGTETALGANYRASSTVYYAALAGLEEARGRLAPKNPNYFGAGVISPSAPFPLYNTLYITNSANGETIKPWDPSNPYYDTEYQQEFNQAASSATFVSRVSVWNNYAQGVPGPVYKWVRMTAATEQSLYQDVDSDGTIDSSTLIYYNPSQVDSHGNPAPGLIRPGGSPPPTAVQALQVTALAQLPNGSQKMLQYVVAPVGASVTLPAALTLDGNNITTFSVPDSSTFGMQGNDENPPSSPAPPSPAALPPSGCVPNPTPVSAIGYTNNSDSSASNIASGLPGGASQGNFAGLGGTPTHASVNWVGSTLSASLQTVGGLNSLVQIITQSADLVLTGPVLQSDAHNVMPGWMSASAPATVVVNGDLTFNGWHAQGYGILLVTGQFTYDPDASWNGIVLAIGKGIVSATQHGVGQFNGGMLIATTVDGFGNPLPLGSPLGAPTFNFDTNAGSTGIYYSSCWIQYVQSPGSYKILSFREIRQ